MDRHRQLALLLKEGDRLASMPVDSLDAPVPSIEGWTVEKVVRHTGRVHRWVASMLQAGPEGTPAEVATLPKGPDCLLAYRDALNQVVHQLKRLEGDEPTQTFTGIQPSRFWHRRQAQEVSVHRMDAADAVHAAGGVAPDPFAADQAADGIDEWTRFFLAVRWNMRHGAFPDDVIGRTIHIHGTDDPAPVDGAEWLLTFGSEGVEVEASHAKGDVALRGSSQDLLLALWRRRPLESIDIVGDRDLAVRVLDIARF